MATSPFSFPFLYPVAYNSRLTLCFSFLFLYPALDDQGAGKFQGQLLVVGQLCNSGTELSTITREGGLTNQQIQ
jgi:hypothetical protein